MKLKSTCHISSHNVVSNRVKFNRIVTKEMSESNDTKPLPGLPVDLRDQPFTESRVLSSCRMMLKLRRVQLRKLLIETSSKSIIVIEDIDCSVDLKSQRKTGENEGEDSAQTNEKETGSNKKTTRSSDKTPASKVTLSGLLNYIDGLWSAYKGERLIVFTTNHVEKLDHALIRRGRMDKHIELGYCSFDAFKVLENNYLYLKSHVLFDKIRFMLEEVDMTPPDAAENLMPKTSPGDPEGCLISFVL
ncbi:AAA-ATPase ASD, mitochondrial-like protein [Tanacetum coccineum]